MKKFYLSLIAVAAISATAAVGSFALFSDTATNAGNTFSAGSVELGTASTDIQVDEMAPGDAGSGKVTLEYTGDLAAHIGVTGSIAQTGGDPACGTDVLTVKHSGNELDATTPLLVTDVAGAGVVEVPLTWEFDRAAGNVCQNADYSVTVNVHAVQSEHNPEVAGGPIEWQ